MLFFVVFWCVLYPSLWKADIFGRTVIIFSHFCGSTNNSRKEGIILALSFRGFSPSRQETMVDQSSSCGGGPELGPISSLFTALRDLAYWMVLTHPRWLSPFCQSFDSSHMETPREMPLHLLGDSKSTKWTKKSSHPRIIDIHVGRVKF